MNLFGIIFGLVILVGMLGWIIEALRSFIRWVVAIIRGHKESEQEEDAEQSASTDSGIAFKMMKKALKKLGCQPKEEGDNALSVVFQGENFQINCHGVYARIWDPAWAFIKDDDPRLGDVAGVVNRANYNIYPTIVVSGSDEESIAAVLHSRMDIILHPSLPYAEGYVNSTLLTFFQAKEAVRAEFQNLDTHQQEHREEGQKIGFHLPADNEKDNTPE